MSPLFTPLFNSFTTNSLGDIFLTGILEVQAYNKVSVEVVPGPGAPAGMTVMCTMGKLSGETLAAEVGQFPFATAAAIHTFNVVGPEFSVVIVGGPANTAVPVQAWVFLN